MEDKSAKPQIHAYSLKFFVLLVFLLFCVQLSAQRFEYEPGSASRKALKHYKAAEKAFIDRDNLKTVKYLSKATQADPRFKEAWLLMGDAYSDMNKRNLAINAYEKAISVDSVFFVPVYYLLGRHLYHSQRYHESVRALKTFLRLHKGSNELKLLVENLLRSAEFSVWATENPVAFEPVNLGTNINSDDDEYVNAVRLDGGVLYFTRKFLDDGIFGASPVLTERFFFSMNDQTGWTASSQLVTNWTVTDFMGAMTLSADARSLYFSACGWPGGAGSCDLYKSEWTGIQWDEPESLGNRVNSPQWDSQPTLSSDGNEMIFVSNRGGGLGGSDLWMSIRLPDGRWGMPVNLGANINTTGNEMAPFLHPDGKTLYFSSTGHPGLGGADLFVARRDVAGRWLTVENLGYPINTSGDEINLVVDAPGRHAFISAIREGGFGGYDIYSFELSPSIRPESVSFVRATVMDAESGLKLKAAYTLTDLDSGSTVAEGRCSLPDGSFLAALPSGRDYGLHVTHKGYLFYSDNFALANEDETDPYMLTIKLQPVSSGTSLVLNNVFFDHDKSELRKESFDELNKLTNFLNDHPLVRIELGGHTDSTGTEEHNIRLSLERAGSVKQYLINKGINPLRIKAVGYGSSVPIADNLQEEGRALNRRTELKLVD